MTEAAGFNSVVHPRVVLEQEWVGKRFHCIRKETWDPQPPNRQVLLGPSGLGNSDSSKHIWKLLLHLSVTLAVTPAGDCFVIRKSGFGSWGFLYEVWEDSSISTVWNRDHNPGPTPIKGYLEAQMVDRTCACVWRVALPLARPALWDRMAPEFRNQPLGSDHGMRIPTLLPGMSEVGKLVNHRASVS